MGGRTTRGRRRPRRRRSRDVGQTQRTPSARCARRAITPKAIGDGLLPVLQRRHRRPLCAPPKHGAERVAVVDFDVHHGNGTQEIFWSDKDLFYGSTHQMPLFPGTGALRERGVGNIFNAPLRAGDGRERFDEAFEAAFSRPFTILRPMYA